MKIKTQEEINKMKKAGEIVYMAHQLLKENIKPGITTFELDKIAHDFILSQGANPSFKNYGGFPGSICTSVNEEVVHGIPSNRKLIDGDIISIDIGASYLGYHGDSAWTYKVGNVSSEKKFLLKHTEEALYKGLSVIKDGCYVGDISHAIESYASENNLGVIKELVGHGIGKKLHEKPDVPNFGIKGKGPKLKAGMIIAVEPMLNLGTAEIYILDDEWTIVTADNKPSAHFEHTVLITDKGYEILTKRWKNGKRRHNWSRR